jgi:hypothetical protein
MVLKKSVSLLENKHYEEFHICRIVFEQTKPNQPRKKNVNVCRKVGIVQF